MRPMPKTRQIDSTLALKRAPYEFISRTCHELSSDVFETRLLGRKTLCMGGCQAAEVFYDTRRFMRGGASLEPLQRALFGTSGVHTLDGAAHRHRKAMLLAMLSPARAAKLAWRFRDELRHSARHWVTRPQVVLYDELQEILARCVCAWSGLPVEPEALPQRTVQLAAFLEAPGRMGMQQVRSRFARMQAEHWLAELVRKVREGTLIPSEDSAFEVVALHRDLSGRLLEPREAAAELSSVLRPTVALSVYVSFLVHALHEFPRARALVERGGRDIAEAFVHEVRRYYPFFPAVPARVCSGFRWNGYVFEAGMRALLDLHGINHDVRIWDAPQEFRPQRFLRRDGDSWTFVPQGGGDHLEHHRCPGEWLTVELMRQALEFFTREIRYSVPPQDLSIDMQRLPALPKSRMILRDVLVLAPGTASRLK